MDTDTALAARLARDLEAAFPTLVEDHQDRLFTIALRLLGDSRDAEEVAQDALVRAFRAIAGYSPDRTAALRLRPWLAAITVNLARNKRRRHDDRHPAVQLEPMLAEGFEPADESGTEPAMLAAGREANAAMTATLGQLPSAIRVAIVLRHVDGLSVAETAEALGRPEGTIKAQVARGLERLRLLLAEADSAGSPPRRGATAGSSAHTPPSNPGRAFAAAEVLS